MPDPWIAQLVEDVLDKHGVGIPVAPICPDCQIAMSLRAENFSAKDLWQCSRCARIEAQ